MKSWSIICLLLLFNDGHVVAQTDYQHDEQERRHATALEWSEFTQRGETAIREWLLANRGEEQIESRGYYTFWDVENENGRRYLLIETSLKPARGNYGSIDFVLIDGDKNRRPFIYHFGEYTDRYPIKITPSIDGVHISFVAHEGGQVRSTVQKNCILKINRDSLYEEAVELLPSTSMPGETTTVMQATNDRKYVTQAGITAAKIARMFGLKIDQLILLNPDVDWTKLKVGQTIKVRADQ